MLHAALVLLFAAVAAADFGFQADRNISCPGDRRELTFTAPAGHKHANSRVLVHSVGAPVDFALKDAFQGREIPTNGTLSLTMGKPGNYTLEFVYYPEEGSFAIGQSIKTQIEAHQQFCSSVSVSPSSGCKHDRFLISWKVPAAAAAGSDWLGLHDAESGELVHWCWLSGDQVNRIEAPAGNLTLRFASTGTLKARYHTQVANAGGADSDPFAVVDQEGCGLHVPLMVASGAPDTPGGRGEAQPMSVNPVTEVVALDGLTALQLPAATLPPSAPAITISMWVCVLLQGADYEAILFKGSGDRERTPGVFIEPKSRRLTLRVSTTESKDEHATTNSSIALQEWVHLAVVTDQMSANLYMDGQLAVSLNSTAGGSIVYNNANLYFSGTPMMSIKGYKGLAANISVSNYAWNSSQVMEAAKQQPSTTPPQWPQGATNSTAVVVRDQLVAQRYFDAAEELHRGKAAITSEGATAGRVLQLYQQAAAASNLTAQARVAQLLMLGSSEVRDQANAVVHLELLASTGKMGCTREAAEAAMLLGCCQPAGVDEQMLLLAAVCGDSSATLMLASLPGQEKQCTARSHYLNTVAGRAQVHVLLRVLAKLCVAGGGA